MKTILTLTAVALLGTPILADSHAGPSPEVVEQIEAKLAEMECQMDPDDIEVEDDGYELDDVICKGGNQFDIELDKDLNEVGRRAE